MSLLSLLRSSCTLRRQSTTKDTSGGAVVTYADVDGQQNVSCDVQPAGADVTLRLLQRELVVSHTVYLAQDIGARASDLLVTDRGKTYLVVEGGYEEPASGYDSWPAVVHVREVIGP